MRSFLLSITTCSSYLQYNLAIGGKTMVMCPECESDLDLDEHDVEEGDVVECPECGTEFEVVSTGPLEMAKINGDDEEEKDDDFDEDEEEDEEE